MKSRRRAPIGPVARFAATLLCVAAGLGCATSYTESILLVRTSVNQGDYAGGIRALDEVLGVDEPHELPGRWKSDTALTVLERGSLLQASGAYAESAASLSAAEKQLELLDLQRDPIGEIGKYIYSGDSAVYRTPPTEQLSVNAVNMLNYLAVGDLAGARVEARRFTVIRDYLREAKSDEAHAPFAAYLAGFVFEQLGDADEALRYYDNALQGRSFSSLREPVARLAARGAFRGSGIVKVLQGAPASAGTSAGGDLLVVVARGRVPYKVPERIPIGAAVGLAGAFVTGDLDILKYSALKVVTYPELVSGPRRAEGSRVTADGQPLSVELASEPGRAIRREYEVIKPRIIGAALTRMIARAAVAEGARVAGKQAGKQAGAGGAVAGLLGLVTSLAIEGSLVALDDPDTRSWTFLPDVVDVARARLPAGEHSIGVLVKGIDSAPREMTVSIPEGGFAVVVVAELR